MHSMHTPLLLLLSFGMAAQAPKLEPGTPQSVGCDAQALARASKVFAGVVKKNQVLGAVVMVVRGNTIVLHEAFGWRDLERKQPLRKHALFRMASNTKAVTAAAILSLVDAGKMQLGDPVAQWLPSWGQGNAKKITVQQLLTHSSGLRIDSLFLRPLTISTSAASVL